MSYRLTDGFKTTISFSLDASVKIWEKEVTPPGLDAGGGIDQTSMRNTRYRTKMPKRLATATDPSFKAFYDPDCKPQILAMLGVNQAITFTYPDGSTEVIWGWLDTFTPGPNTEGAAPLADCKIMASNMDASLNEIAPVETPG